MESQPKKHWIYSDGKYEEIYRHERERVLYGFSTYDWFNFSTFLSETIVGGLRKFREEGSGYPAECASMEEWRGILAEMIEGFELHRDDDLDGMVEDATAEFGWRMDEDVFKEKRKKYERAMELFSKFYLTLWD
jgi:hypothetical protein